MSLTRFSHKTTVMVYVLRQMTTKTTTIFENPLSVPTIDNVDIILAKCHFKYTSPGLCSSLFKSDKAIEGDVEVKSDSHNEF